MKLTDDMYEVAYDTYEDEPVRRDPLAGLCTCKAHTQPHDHAWTGEECEHEYPPYTERRGVGLDVFVCLHCDHELEADYDP